MTAETRPFSTLTEAEKGQLDPSIGYRHDPGAPFDFVDVQLDGEAHPVMAVGEQFSSRWMGAGGALYQYAGTVEPVTFGGMYCALTGDKLVAGWYEGIQSVRDDAPSLDNTPAQVAFVWQYDSIGQIFIEGHKRRLKKFEPHQLRIIGGRQGLAQLVLQAVARADQEWRGVHNASQVDFRGFAESLAAATGKKGAQWKEGPSPFKDGEYALLLEV